MDVCAPQLPDFARYRVEPEEHRVVADEDAGDTGGFADASEVEVEYAGLVERIAGLQERL